MDGVFTPRPPTIQELFLGCWFSSFRSLVLADKGVKRFSPITHPILNIGSSGGTDGIEDHGTFGVRDPVVGGACLPPPVPAGDVFLVS